MHVPEPPPRRLVPVLAGGGTRLPAHVGVLAALADFGIAVPQLVGVSGGSIVAALAAAGWSPQRLFRLALDVDFRRFRGRSLWQLARRGGLSSGEDFEHWLDELLEGRRFRDLPKDLAVVATDVHTSQPVVFDRRSAPDERVAHAVRCSMGIPLLFAFQPWRDHLLVDGSILSEDALQRDWSGDGTPVCFFRLRGAPDTRPLGVHGLFPLPAYLSMLIRTFMTTLSREFIDARHWPRTVVVDVGPYSPIDFALGEAHKRELYACGYETVRNILPFKFPELCPLPDAP